MFAWGEVGNEEERGREGMVEILRGSGDGDGEGKFWWGWWSSEKHTRIALVRVLPEILALGDLQVRLGDDLVEGVCAAGELLAGVAVAIPSRQ